MPSIQGWTESAIAIQAGLTAERPTSAYVHIPFCRRRCFYCDFPVSVVGDKPPVTANAPAATEPAHSSYGTIAHYIDVLCQEIRLTSASGQSLKTVFFGGGTPSLLSVEQLAQILDTLDRQFAIASDAEISIEIDPGTFDLTKINGYRSAGVNRVSLGVQTFQSNLLTLCGRSHTVTDVYDAVRLIQTTGLTNFSLDLISGLPHQTLEHWQDSLQQAIALAPAHISCYDLTIESVTAFGRQYKPGVSPLPSDEMAAEMYRLAQKTLTAAGYDHYEISNYAKPGHQCRHNRVYWENRPFYGFGMGATSYVDGDRLSRPRKTREYYAWVEERRKDEDGRMKSVATSSHPSLLTPHSSLPHSPEQLLDTLMLGLRLAEGLDLAALTQRFGKATLRRVWKCLHPFYKQGWVMVVSETEVSQQVEAELPETGRLKLSDPEGFLFSNVILVTLFEEFE